MSKSICIISHQHLCRNPRVFKEAIALEKTGAKVTILTIVYNQVLLNEDNELLKNKKITYVFYHDTLSTRIGSLKNKAMVKLGRWMNSIGLENKWALGYAPALCLKMALKQKADLYICHQELPMYIGTKLLKKGKKVAFDIEDWYTNDLLPEAQKYRPQQLLQRSESIALTLGNLVYTTSEPMAKEIAKNYQAKVPEVIFNTFNSLTTLPIKTREDDYIKLIWISQTIGPGRGLEDFVTSMNEIHNNSFELNLRGNISEDYKLVLLEILKNHNHRINFLPSIPNVEIQADLANYDIGLALEPNFPPNKDLTISNKIFHYLSVGLPVIASATKGQLSLKEDFEGLLYYYSCQNDLSQILSSIQKGDLAAKKDEILSIFREKYDWQIAEKKIQKLINQHIS